jgi:hypothetical protein
VTNGRRAGLFRRPSRNRFRRVLGNNRLLLVRVDPPAEQTEPGLDKRNDGRNNHED